MNLIHRAICIGLLGLASAPALSQGQEQSARDDLLDLSLDELTQLRVTSSTLTDETLRSVPSAMTVFSRSDIRRLGLTELHQLVNLVPGFQSYRSDDSGINFAITSRARRVGTGSREVLILLDGQRLNSEWTGGNNTQEGPISLDNIDRVEFIRGPGSSLYGSNALMGVINLISRSERELSLGLGEHRQRTASAQWKFAGALGSLELFARGQSSQGESLLITDPYAPGAPVASRDPAQTRDFYLRAKVGEFSLALRQARSESERFYVTGYVDEAENLRRGSSNFWNLTWQHVFGPNLSLRGLVYEARRDLMLKSTVLRQPLLLIQAPVDELERGTQWLLQNNGGVARWLLGFEWRRPDIVNVHYSLGPPGSLNPPLASAGAAGPRTVVGWFGQLQYALTEQLELTAGLRADHYSDSGGRLSPRLGLVWQASAQDSAKLLYSEAFRAPSRLEISSTSSTFLGNPDLLPEVAKTTELIWLRSIGAGQISATLFQAAIANAITEVVTPSLQRTWVNGKAKRSGLELDATLQIDASWQARLALTQMFQDQATLGAQSRSFFGGSLSYQGQQWSAALLSNYQGRMLDPNEQNDNIGSIETTPFGGQALWAAHLSWQPKVGGTAIELHLHIDNLFDRNTLWPANRPANAVGVPGKGRLISAGLRWQFD